MGGAEEEWVKAAMTDDTMVVELLVRLHGAVAPPPPPPPTLPLEWTVRQRRSRPVTVNAKKLAQSQRASPSTPLSWSVATSLSGGSGGAGGGGGSEESSRPNIQNISAATRSKLNGDTEKAISKRSRKKKTLAELKEEENSLLKEKRVLKREIAALRINLEKQRAKNDKLKRIKVEMQPLPNREATSTMDESVSDQLQPETTARHPTPLATPQVISGNAVAALKSSTSNEFPTPPDADAAFNPTFMLPDLNMPLEDPCPDVLCSAS